MPGYMPGLVRVLSHRTRTGTRKVNDFICAHSLCLLTGALVRTYRGGAETGISVGKQVFSNTILFCAALTLCLILLSTPLYIALLLYCVVLWARSAQILKQRVFYAQPTTPTHVSFIPTDTHAQNFLLSFPLILLFATKLRHGVIFLVMGRWLARLADGYLFCLPFLTILWRC